MHKRGFSNSTGLKNISAVDHFVKNPYDGTKSQWFNFDAELRTAAAASCGLRGLEYMFTKWPGNKPNDPEFMHKMLLDDLGDVESIRRDLGDGQEEIIEVTYEMRRDRRDINKD
jgi:hypothetical protein